MYRGQRRCIGLKQPGRRADKSAVAAIHRALQNLVALGGKRSPCLYRWDEVIGPAAGRCILGKGVRYAILGSRHTIEHAGQAMLVAAEADKHRPMGSRRPERSIAAEDMLFYPMLFDHRARDM